MDVDFARWWEDIRTLTRALADARGWWWDDALQCWLPIVGNGPGDIKHRESIRWMEEE